MMKLTVNGSTELISRIRHVLIFKSVLTVLMTELKMIIMNVTPKGKWGKEKTYSLNHLSRGYNPENRELSNMTFRAYDDNGEEMIIKFSREELNEIIRLIGNGKA